MHKTPHVFPIVGGRNVNHLKGNIEALKLSLSKEEMDEIDDAAPFDVGFPLSFLYAGKKDTVNAKPSDNWLLASNAHVDTPDKAPTVKPRSS